MPPHAPPVARGRISDAFCFWTNKGGVGKTTMCFHAATSFALTHPDIQVICVDLDPQANLSAALLTQLGNNWNGEVERAMWEGWQRVEKNQHTLLGPVNGQGQRQFPKTILGFFMSTYHPRHDTGFVQPLSPGELLIDMANTNTNLPENMKLLCGDRRLHCITDQMVKSGSTNDGTAPRPVWVRDRRRLKELLELAARECDQETVVFVDTNPTLDVLTETALVTCSKLIVVTLSDYFSVISLRNILYLLHGINLEEGMELESMHEHMFWYKAKQYFLAYGDNLVPKIHTVLINKLRIVNQSSSQADNSILNQQIEVVRKMIEKIKSLPQIKVSDVFSRIKENTADPGKKLVAHMTDMQSAGVIAMRCGLPLWALKRNRVEIGKQMGMTHCAITQKSYPSQLLELVGKKGCPDPDLSTSVTVDGGRFVTILEALTEGRPQVGIARIRKAIEEAQKDASGAFGKRQKT